MSGPVKPHRTSADAIYFLAVAYAWVPMLLAVAHVYDRS